MKIFLLPVLLLLTLAACTTEAQIVTGSTNDDATVDDNTDDSLAEDTIMPDEDSMNEAPQEAIQDDAESDFGEPDVTFDLTGVNFAFFMDGMEAPELRVKQGDVVKINFMSTDGFHDWVVDEFDAATAKVQTNGTTSVTFVADQAGTFEYYCSVGQHRANGMVGSLIVEA